MTANWRCRQASRRSGKVGSRLVISITAESGCRSEWTVMVATIRRCVSAGLAPKQKRVRVACLPGEAVTGTLVRGEKSGVRQTNGGIGHRPVRYAFGQGTGSVVLEPRRLHEALAPVGKHQPHPQHGRRREPDEGVERRLG